MKNKKTVNPLTVFWMNLPEKGQYLAFDIDQEEVKFVKEILEIVKPKFKVRISVGDLLADQPRSAEVIFLLKMLPCLEKQERGISKRLVEGLNFKSLIISFSIKTLSGKEKNMTDFYSHWTIDLAKESNLNLQKIVFPNELVFILSKI